MSAEIKEKGPTPEYPYSCPDCGSDLEERGAVYIWRELPERSVGHLETGEGGGVNLVFDKAEYNPPPTLQCVNCGETLESLTIEQMFLDEEAEIEEDFETELPQPDGISSV